MKFLKWILPLAVIFGLNSQMFAADDNEQDRSAYQEELNERDFEALRDYLNTKRTIPLEEKDDALSISGDVRTEWRHMNEFGRVYTSLNPPDWYYQDYRGSSFRNSKGLPISQNDFDIEFNLKFDYVCNRAWAVAHLQYDNSAGVAPSDKSCSEDPWGWHGSGNCDNLCLRKAYMGYNLLCGGGRRLDIELGRRGNLYHVFDSRVQFLSRFDGLLLKYSDDAKYFDFVWKVAGFLVDERVNQFAWVTQFEFLDINETGLDLKYSFIDWEFNGKNRCGISDPMGFKFLNSQWTAIYHIDPKKTWGKPTQLYAAFLVNHAHSKDWNTLERFVYGKTFGKNNIAWYAGFTIGEVVKENDWSLDVQYQYVQQRSIPDDDVSGIGRGNTLDYSATQIPYLMGNVNYRGPRMEFLYAFTNNLTLDLIVESSRQIKKTFGGRHKFYKTELEAIYAF